MPSLELSLRVFAAAFLVGGTAFVSYTGAALLFRPAAALARWVAVAVLGMTLSTVGFHALLNAHQFNPVAALVLVAAGAAAAALTGRAAFLRAARLDARLLGRVRRLFRKSRWRGWVAAFGVLCLAPLLRPFVTPPISWEALMVRLVKPAMWIQQGGGPALVLDRGVPTWLLYRNDQAGGEVFTALAMLPFHSHLFAGVASSVQWIALGLAILLLARELGAREPHASATAGFLLTMAPIRLLVGSGYIDIALALTTTAALAFVVRYLRRGCRASLVVACAAAGLASSIKLIGLPLGLLVLAFLAVLAVRRRHLSALAAGAVTFVALASPWLIYNLLDTGRPLPEVDVNLFGLELGRANEAVVELVRRAGEPSWNRELAALDTLFQGLTTERPALIWELIVPFAVAFAALPALARRLRPAALLFGAVTVLLLGLFFAPQTAGWRYSNPESFGRILLPLVIFVGCVAALRRGRGYFTFLLFVTFFVLFRMLLVYAWLFEIDDIMFIVLSAFVLGAVTFKARRWLRLAVCTAGGLLVVFYLAAHRPVHRDDALWNSRFVHKVHNYWVEPSRMLDEPERPHKIAVTHGVTEQLDSGLFYYLMGSELQNELVYVNPAKDPDDFVFNPWAAFAKVGYNDWLNRLLAGKIEYVVSFDRPSLELTWMEKHPEQFRRLWGSPGIRGLFLVLSEEVLSNEP